MADKMIVKFEKYWDEYSAMIALGVSLDPRMKFSTLEYCYTKMDPLIVGLSIEEVKN